MLGNYNLEKPAVDVNMSVIELQRYLYRLTEEIEYNLSALSFEGKKQAKNENEGNSVPFWKQIYPVGSIYLSVSDTSPDKLFGGRWEKIKDRFLLSSGDSFENGETGGEKEHRLTLSELPKHRPSFSGDGIFFTDSRSSEIRKGGTAYPGSPSVGAGSDWSSQGFIKFDEIGGDEPHDNMPPYLVVNVWIRTA